MLSSDVTFKMFEIFGTKTTSLFGMLKSSSLSGVATYSSITLIPWMDPGLFVWLYTMSTISIK